MKTPLHLFNKRSAFSGIALVVMIATQNANTTPLTHQHFPKPLYHKVNGSGKILNARDTLWECVLDQSTKLVWELKTNEGQRNKNTLYRWGGKVLDTYGYTESDDKGFYGKSELAAVGTLFHDWTTLVDHVNQIELCGLTTWRVPTIVELASLSSYYYTGALKGTYGQRWDVTNFNKHLYTNINYFKDLKDMFLPYFWSSTGDVGYSAGAWQLYHGDGRAYIDQNRNSKASIRLVSHAPQTMLTQLSTHSPQSNKDKND